MTDNECPQRMDMKAEAVRVINDISQEPNTSSEATEITLLPTTAAQVSMH